MTRNLYWQQPIVTNFQAQILDSFSEGGTTGITLDQTAFFPTGGGQPCDLGTIASVPVTDVIIRDDGTIHHHLESTLDLPLGAVVACTIDIVRRRELTQQHTGQHILSQAFFQLFGAETCGFRITPQDSEIDLTLDAPADEVLTRLQHAEDLANQIVFENRPIRTHLVTPEESAQMPLRKESYISDCVRVIEIADFDWSACGGTHATQTGEVGLIVIKHWERAKQMVRVGFLCGVRALHDYRAANGTAESVARQFSVARETAPDAVARLIEENKQLSRQIRVLTETSAQYEADELRRSAFASNSPKIIRAIFANRNNDELKMLAHQLVKVDDVVALLASKEKSQARLVFARSANLSFEMGTFMREACQRLNGRGGGTPDFAQGGATNLEGLDAALQNIEKEITGVE